MRIIVDVYDALGNRLGSGPVDHVLSASVKRALDGAGTIKLDFPANDQRVLDLIQNERRVRIYVENDGAQRELGRGVIRNVRTAPGDSPTISAQGPDSLDALTRRSVLLNRQYNNQPISTIADNLISLVPGWSASVETAVASDLQTGRFDGVSILKALIRMCEEKGIHLREGVTANTVELGRFGTQTSMVLTNLSAITREVHSNDDLILIDNLTVTQDSEAVANWIIPLGAGEGQAALTLRDSTRTAPYAIQTITGPDGQTLYYMADNASIAANGQIEKVYTFKSIAPISNSASAKELAANALYDAAAAQLQRDSQRQAAYRVSGLKVRQQVRPGDKIRLVYKGEAYRDNRPVVAVDVNDWFWVLSVTETVSESGMSISLEISSVDKAMQDEAQVIVGKLEAVDIRNVAVQTFPCYYQDSSERVCQGWPGLPPSYPAAKNAIFSLQFPDMMTDVISVKFQIISRPLYMHTDEYWGTVAPTPLKNWYTIEGTNYPCDLGIIVNGSDVTSALGGPWNPGGGNSPVDTTLDISSYILNAVGGIFQTHTIQIYCGHKNVEQRVSTGYQSQVRDWSNGVIEGKFMVLGTAQAILPA